jgi:predicted permease
MTSVPFLLRVAVWLLKRRLSPELAEFILGDLEEEFHRRRAASRLSATVWLITQTLLCTLRPPRRRPVSAHDEFVLRNPVHYLRESIRAFRARPLLTATCIVIVAVGVGSVTAVSSGVYALLYRPLPLPESERLVSGFALREGFDPFGTSLLEFSAFQSRATSFEMIGLARQQTSAVRVGNETVRVQSAAVTAGYLPTVGVTPVAGRPLTSSDDRPGAPAVVLISHSFWVQHFAQRADVVGSTLAINGHPTTVVGIMPTGFDLPFAAEVWVPLQLAIDALPLDQRLPSAYSFIARLRAGTPFERANADVAAIARSLAEEYPQRRGWTYRLIGLRQQLLGDIDGRTTRVIGVLIAAVVFLLAICCVNVANLLLLRATERERDEAVRLAIGASGRQLALERFSEYLGIGLVGGLVGMALSMWIAPALAALNPIRATSFAVLLTDFRPDGVMFAIGGFITLMAAIAIGMAPRIRLVPAPEVAAALVSTATRAGVSRTHKLHLRLLVATQIAMAVLLLVGGGLVLRSFEALRSVDLGFRSQGIVSTQLTLPPATYGDHRRRAADLERLLSSVRLIPGVIDAGITTNIPLQRVSFDSFYTVEDRPSLNPNDVPITAHRVVTPDYLRLIGVRLIRGRLLNEGDTAEAPRVAVVTEELARQAWAGQDPIGRRIRRGRASDQRPWLTVVGVVEDVKEDRFNFRIDRAVWYLPYAQEDSSAAPNLVVQAHGDPRIVAPALRERVRSFDPNIGMSDPVSLQSHVADLLSTERFAAVLLSMLAVSGLLLATLGLYGAISHIVRAQRAEIALRIAVGAPRGHVVRMIVREVMLVALGGTFVGTALAAAGASGLGSILYQVEPHDGMTYGGVILLLIIASGLAACAPALRAVRVDPARLLR